MTVIKKHHWLRNTLIALICAGLLGVALAGFLFVKNPERAYAVSSIRLAFDGAAENKAPNGYAFSVDEILKDEVLAGALRKSGLEGRVTPETVRENLFVRGAYPESFVSRALDYESLMDFSANRQLSDTNSRPVQYSVILYGIPGLKQAETEGLLREILAGYTEYFANHSGLRIDDTADTLFDLDAYDYPQQIEIVQTRLDRLSRYAKQMYQNDPTFRLNGIGFNDIYTRYDALRENNLGQLESTLTMKGLTKDAARLIAQYRFTIRDLTYQREAQTERLERLDSLIASYKKNEVIYLSTSDSLTKIDGNSSETYDSLMNLRKTVADGIAAIDSGIARNELRIRDLIGEDAEPEDGETVNTRKEDARAENKTGEQTRLEGQIAAVLQQKDAITQEFEMLLDAYSREQINEDTFVVTAVRYEAPRLVSGAFAVKAVKTAGPLCAVTLIVCLILLIADRRKEQKAA